MRKLIATCLAATLAATGFVAAPALAQPRNDSRNDQGEVRREMRAGNVLPLREIERRVLPRMKGSEYLGPAYDSSVKVYRLKFIRDGRVIFVDVDARSGRIVRRSR